MRISLALALATVLAFASDPSTPTPAAAPLGCAGSATLGTFQISVRPFGPGKPLPLKAVAQIPAGSRLIWSPAHLRLPPSNGAEVTAVVVPSSGGVLRTLEPRKASHATEWQLLDSPAVIAIVYGPQGLSEGKLESLVSRNQDLLRELADYAEQSSEVEAMIQELADAEQSRAGADDALRGVSAEYGVSSQKLSSASTDQQASLLLKALIPAAGSYDPLGAQSSQLQQTGGLAASVAGLFFGNPVGWAAGGAALFANLKTILFPNTEFRSAFAQAGDKGNLALCTKNQTPRSKTRAAYLWAYRVPQWKPPSLALAKAPHLPLGAKSTLEVKFGKNSSARELALARDWRLVPVAAAGFFPVAVEPTPAGALEVDLSKAVVPAGDYQLAATWDWDPMPVSGTLHVQEEGDLAGAALAPGAHDKLVEGRGSVTVELSGPDFEFLNNVAIQSSARDAKLSAVEFTLPLGKRGGPQNLVAVTIDTAKQGAYTLILTQEDGTTHKLPIRILPPNPKVSGLPIRLNAGETVEPIHLSGSSLERVEGISTDAGAFSGGPDSGAWSGEIHLKAGVKKGQTFGLQLKVKDLEAPLVVADAIEVEGPRPRILAVRRAPDSGPGIEIGSGELPADTAAGLVLSVDRLHGSARPKLELECQTGELRQALTLSPGTPSAGASLTSAGPGALYLSVDPGVVGYPGCQLAAKIVIDPEGASDPFVLGRVIRVPRLDRFTLTSEKVGDASYAGSLEGRDLDVIEKVGWNSADGMAVDSIPVPLPGKEARQSLRIVLPWPAPGPHAPLYIWLRGESSGRKTAVEY